MCQDASASEVLVTRFKHPLAVCCVLQAQLLERKAAECKESECREEVGKHMVDQVTLGEAEVALTHIEVKHPQNLRQQPDGEEACECEDRAGAGNDDRCLMPGPLGGGENAAVREELPFTQLADDGTERCCDYAGVEEVAVRQVLCITKEVFTSFVFHALHPDLVGCPLIIIRKTHLKHKDSKTDRNDQPEQLYERVVH